jgi:hypothetical protein
MEFLMMKKFKLIIIIASIAMLASLIMAGCDPLKDAEWTLDRTYATLVENKWSGNVDITSSGGEQWFRFEATASTQYIHVVFGTLTNLNVEIYDDSGDAVGASANLSGNARFISRSLTSGQTYYIRVSPHSGSGSYRIAFNESSNAPITLPSTATTLTEGQWEDGSIASLDEEQWFMFTATASTQYIHVTFGTLYYLDVQVYDSSGDTVGEYFSLFYDTRSASRSLTPGQTYYIRVWPIINYGNESGNYQIAFNASFIPPGADCATLTEGQWEDIAASLGEVQWFMFTATASTQYIHFILDTVSALYVRIYDSSGDMVGDEYLSRYASWSLTSGQTYYIRVRPESIIVSPDGTVSANYRIAFNASIIAPGADYTTLIEGQWADGNIASSGGEQWFMFTATASTQFIHVAFGTLTNLYVRVYDTSGGTVGDSANLSGNTPFASRSLVSGQTYYIMVSSAGSSYSGTYRIAFNASIVAPGNDYATLTEGQWASNIATSGEVQWFMFTATASTQYIHAAFGTLAGLMRVQIYDSSGNAVGDNAQLSGSTGYDRSASRSLTPGQTYYIRVWGGSGTYQIAFNASSTAPAWTPFANPIQLAQAVWEDGSIATSGEQWFMFTATASTQYIHVAPGTLTVFYVQIYDSNGNTAGASELFNGPTRSYSRSLTPGQAYYIRVWPHNNSSYSGTYQIAFNESSTVPPITLPSTATLLTENKWANGNIASSSVEQWFRFTATASTQYIHVIFGTLTDLSVQIYDSSGNVVGDNAYLYGSTGYDRSASRSLESGQTYYIRVWSYSSGTYQIAFNDSSTVPPITLPSTATTLAESQWADGNIASSSGEQWFRFTATAYTQFIHFILGTLPDLGVRVYDSTGGTEGTPYLYGSTGSNHYASWSLVSGQTYYIRVWPPSNSYSGTYRIAFNASIIAPGVDYATLLTEGQWTNGNIASVSEEQWFRFTATASTQYIHVTFGTLIDLSVQIYDSSGSMVGDGAQLHLLSGTRSASWPLTPGQTYYIRVSQYSSSYSGTYQIAFNASDTAPAP